MERRRGGKALAVALASSCVLAACGSSDAGAPAARVRMDFARPDFFAAPFPSDDLRRPDGRVDLSRYPNPTSNPFVAQALGVLASDARGFATTGGAFFALTAPLDPASLPDLASSTGAASPVLLIDTADGARWPVEVAFDPDGGPFGARNLLSVVPFQGLPLAAGHTYAVVVRRGVRGADGRAVEPGPEMVALARGDRPAALGDDAFARYEGALGALDHAGVPRGDLAALAVFTTGDPTAEMLATTKAVLAEPLPALDAAPALGDVFEGYCVYNAHIALPDLQAGALPFAHDGGRWAFDAAGRPIVARRAPSRVVITVPRAPAPAGGYPIGVLIRTGAGGDRPLTDRGAHPTPGGQAAPGSGPARELALAGFAGATFDGPHGGARNPTNGDEQFLMFNVENFGAIRDNVRQSALETALVLHVLAGLSFDGSACPGASPVVRFDATRAALLGHSMGATIAPLALAAEPLYRAAVLGGAGASWIENMLFKQKPLALRPIVELLLGYTSAGRSVSRGDPALTLVQWVLEPADPLVYAPRLVRAPPAGEAARQILVQQGIVDHYIMPTIANALTVSLGLDLAGPSLDDHTPELTADPAQTPVRAVLPLSGRAALPLPVSGNAGGATAVVRQYAEDGIEDGHEVMFQVDAAKAEYRCFLSTFAAGAGAPVVTEGACP